MNILKNKFTYIALGAVIAIVPFAVSFFTHPEESKETDIRATNSNLPDWHRNVTQVEIPRDASIFGEKLPLDNWEVRERFEREFFYNYTNADQLSLWWKRLKRYERLVDSSLKAAGLHSDYKYLMVAESGVRNVQSPAKAHGFWQFIPPTGERYGLQVDDKIDERLDPIKATQAAMLYLQKLRAQFGNDLLAAAAYNRGESGLAIAMNEQRQDNYWNLILPEETMRYILRIAAIKELMTNGERYGFNFNRLEPYHEILTRTVTVYGPVSSIADWAISQGYTYKDVKILNPWLISKNIPSGTFEIALPANDNARTTVSSN